MHPRSPGSLPPLSKEDEELLQAISESMESGDSSTSLQLRRSFAVTTSPLSSAVTSSERRKKTIGRWMRARRNDNTVLLTYQGAVYLHQKPIDVRARDVRSLGNGEYINDVIINLVLRMMWTAMGSERSRQVHIFPPYFFTALRENGYNKVKKWYPAGLFTRTYLVVPVHENYHWFLVIVRLHPTILILSFDSMGHDRFQACACMQRFLVMAAFDQKPEERVYFPARKRLFRTVKAPLQTNYVDCGLYALHFSKLFLGNPRCFVGERVPTFCSEEGRENELWGMSSMVSREGLLNILYDIC
ncbi:cysteine proteinase [Peniophora sp. CONT]|nr:cysteine proteinase [Peniophora sp. CONT]